MIARDLLRTGLCSSHCFVSRIWEKILGRVVFSTGKDGLIRVLMVDTHLWVKGFFIMFN